MRDTSDCCSSNQQEETAIRRLVAGKPLTIIADECQGKSAGPDESVVMCVLQSRAEVGVRVVAVPKEAHMHHAVATKTMHGAGSREGLDHSRCKWHLVRVSPQSQVVACVDYGKMAVHFYDVGQHTSCLAVEDIIVIKIKNPLCALVDCIQKADVLPAKMVPGHQFDTPVRKRELVCRRQVNDLPALILLCKRGPNAARRLLIANGNEV